MAHDQIDLGCERGKQKGAELLEEGGATDQATRWPCQAPSPTVARPDMDSVTSVEEWTGLVDTTAHQRLVVRDHQDQSAPPSTLAGSLAGQDGRERGSDGQEWQQRQRSVVQVQILRPSGGSFALMLEMLVMLLAACACASAAADLESRHKL